MTPATIIENKKFQFNTQFAHEPTYKKIIRNWKDNITSMGDYNKSMIQNSTILKQTEFTKFLANNKPIIIASDGSVYKSSSGGAWLIATIEGNILVTRINRDTSHQDF